MDQAVARGSWTRSFHLLVTIEARRTREDSYQAYARRPRRLGASSIYRGVSFRKKTKLWTAQVYWRGRRYFLGSFETEREAALAYNMHAQKIIGNLALLNDLSGAEELGPSGAILEA